MRSTNLGAVKAARRAVDLVLAEGEFDRHPVPYFAPTNLGALPDASQEKERQAREGNEQANRIRAASHECLRAASDALAAALDLGALPMDLATEMRELRLAEAAQRVKAAAEAASSAAGILAGRVAPLSDGAVVVTKSSG